ncbi:MAG: fatty acid CoA ligase family protein [Thermoguttaceae bacterium]
MAQEAPAHVNIAARLAEMAQRFPDAVAVAEPRGYDSGGRRRYRQLTFRQLAVDSDRIACGMRRLGVAPRARLALLVRPGVDFVSLVFANYKLGATIILIDPGMGRRNLVRCLEAAEPEGFVAIPVVHALRTVLRRRFPKAAVHVTVGRRWFWGGATLEQLRQTPHQGPELAPTGADDPAAIIFTTGSTGPPKGVEYSHGNFDAQVDEIRDFYGIQPGEVDVPGFPLFGLFNCAMGVTAVIPDMDPTRPARVNPARIIEAVVDWNATQSFGSPAIWNRVGRHCERTGDRLPTLRRILSAGAPVPAHVLRRMKACIHPEGDVHTPYGATEALPVASIAASEVLAETAARTERGAGVCVGRRFPGIRWKIIRVTDGPIPALHDAHPLPAGQIGELIVTGPVVTRRYVTRTEANALGKIADGPRVWHRMGDVGYLDEQERFWFCGRMAHRVETVAGPKYTIPCEAIVNAHPHVYRSALVGVGRRGEQRPVLIVEPYPDKFPRAAAARRTLLDQVHQLAAAHPLTADIDTFLVHPSFPVDIRHNAKIFREKLALWAARQLN